MLAESPLYQQWMAEANQTAILRFLEARFGVVPEEIAAQVHSLTDLEKLESAIRHAARCKGFADFRKRLARSGG
jgi:hypothetical protein